MFKDRKPGFWLAFAAAAIALLGGIAYLIIYSLGRDAVTGEYDRVYNTLTLGMILGGALISLGAELIRSRLLTILAAAAFGVALANHLVETAYPLADVLTKVPFFGGNAPLAITFAVVFGIVALVHIVSSFMEHNRINS